MIELKEKVKRRIIPRRMWLSLYSWKGHHIMMSHIVIPLTPKFRNTKSSNLTNSIIQSYYKKTILLHYVNKQWTIIVLSQYPKSLPFSISIKNDKDQKFSKTIKVIPNKRMGWEFLLAAQVDEQGGRGHEKTTWQYTWDHFD